MTFLAWGLCIKMTELCFWLWSAFRAPEEQPWTGRMKVWPLAGVGLCSANPHWACAELRARPAAQGLKEPARQQLSMRTRPAVKTPWCQPSVLRPESRSCWSQMQQGQCAGSAAHPRTLRAQGTEGHHGASRQESCCRSPHCTTPMGRAPVQGK